MRGAGVPPPPLLSRSADEDRIPQPGVRPAAFRPGGADRIKHFWHWAAPAPCTAAGIRADVVVYARIGATYAVHRPAVQEGAFPGRCQGRPPSGASCRLALPSPATTPGPPLPEPAHWLRSSTVHRPPCA